MFSLSWKQIGSTSHPTQFLLVFSIHYLPSSNNQIPLRPHGRLAEGRGLCAAQGRTFGAVQIRYSFANLVRGVERDGYFQCPTWIEPHSHPDSCQVFGSGEEGEVGQVFLFRGGLLRRSGPEEPSKHERQTLLNPLRDKGGFDDFYQLPCKVLPLQGVKPQITVPLLLLDGILLCRQVVQPGERLLLPFSPTASQLRPHLRQAQCGERHGRPGLPLVAPLGIERRHAITETDQRHPDLRKVGGGRRNLDANQARSEEEERSDLAGQEFKPALVRVQGGPLPTDDLLQVAPWGQADLGIQPLDPLPELRVVCYPSERQRDRK